MNRTRALATASIVAGMAALGIGALAGPASAHTPAFGKNCNGYSVSLTNYGQGSTRKLVVDGSTIVDGAFSGNYIKNGTWSPTTSHTIGLDVHSSDGPSGDVNWHVTQEPCQEGSTTTATPTTVPVTTTPTTAGATTTTIALTTTTVAATTTAPTAPVAGAPVAPSAPSAPDAPAFVAPVPQKLPATGGGPDWTIVVGGITAMLVGVGLVLTTRRRATS